MLHAGHKTYLTPHTSQDDKSEDLDEHEDEDECLEQDDESDDEDETISILWQTHPGRASTCASASRSVISHNKEAIGLRPGRIEILRPGAVARVTSVVFEAD